jgi:hypothetical protein
MAPSGWSTNDQSEWLTHKLTEYSMHSSPRDYNARFWPGLFETWFQRWPERAVKFPEIDLGTSLTTEQEAVVNVAVGKRQQVSNILGYTILTY